MRIAPWLVLLVLAHPAGAQDPVAAAATKLEKHLSDQDSSAGRIRVLLSRARGTESPVTRAVERLLAREPAYLLLEVAREGRSARDRSFAAGALIHAGRTRDALHVAMLDRSQDPVRFVTGRLASLGHTAPAVDYLARYLRSPSAKTRIRAAEAMADLGHASAVPLLTSALRGVVRTSKQGGARAHVAFLTQTAIVRDFSVEIA